MERSSCVPHGNIELVDLRAQMSFALQQTLEDVCT